MLKKMYFRCLQLLLMWAGLVGAAHAATYTFPGALPSGCSGSGASYTCTSLTLGYLDVLTFSNPTPITVTINGDFSTNTSTINASGSASNVNFVVTGTTTFGYQATFKANLTSGTVSDLNGQCTLGGYVAATSGSVTLGYRTTVAGNVTSNTGAISIGSEGSVGGSVQSTSGAINILNVTTVAGSVSTSGAINIYNSSVISGAVTGGTGAVVVMYQAQVNGIVSTTSGTIEIQTQATAGSCVRSSSSASITLQWQASVNSVCCGSGCGNSCVTNNSSYAMPPACSVSSTPSTFDCLETGTNLPWVASSSASVKPLYTKLTATNFAVDVAALKSDGSLESNYAPSSASAKYVRVELFDTTTPAASCSAYTSPVASQIVTFAPGVYSGAAGRTQTGNFNVTTAQAKLLCRVKECTTSACTAYISVTQGCSTDQFSVRPQQLTVSAATMTNTALTGTPQAVAGSTFTLNAAAGVASGYTGTPAINTAKVVDHNTVAIAAGTFSGSFSAGTGTQASGTAFKYLDVGNILFQADAVVDSGFTSIDQSNGDCVAGSTSNTLSSGKYGCNIGSAATAKLGRWYPSHYSFVGTLTPSCTAGGFTYMDEDALGVALTLKAHASTGGTAAATDPVVSRYTSGYTNLASVTISGDNAGTAVAVSRLGSPAFASMPNTALWSAGQFVINDVYAFSKIAGADGPYDSFKLKAALSDPDGSTLIGSTNETGTTKIRYGQLRLQNAYGSELLKLPVPLEARYWSGSYFVTNTLDKCTTLTLSSVALSGYTGNLAACETQITPTTTQTLSDGKLPSPGLELSKPGSGNSGSVLLTLNVSATASGSTCLSSTATSATAANRPWFGSNPTARATFGVYKSPMIYLRENY